MAYIDNALVLSDAQAVTASAASTNVIDTGVAGRGAGDGNPLELLITVDTTVAASGGASNVTFSLQDSADNSSFADVVRSTPVPKATLVAGHEAFKVKLPHGLRRYVRGYYTVDTNDLTAGKFNMFVTKDRHANTAGAPGFTVS